VAIVQGVLPTIPRMAVADSSLDVLVLGAGTVGMAAALALSRQGLAIGLRDEAPAAARKPDLRAFALNAASVALLRELKVWDALPPDARTAVHEMRVEGDRPGAELEFSAWQQQVAELAWIVDAAELEAALRAALRFAPHVQMLEADRPAALTLIAEGQAGHRRAQLGVAFERHGYGQAAIAARLESSQPHNGMARQWFRSPDVLALLPIDRPRAGYGFALVWSLPDEEAKALLALPDAGFEDALMQACGNAAGSLQLKSERASWPLAWAHAERTSGPGWALLGDAAHVVHPLAGQGLNLGLADVAVLARVVAARESWRSLGDAKLLARYARERAGPVRQMGQLTDGLLHLFASPWPLARELRCRGLTLVDRLPPLKRWLAAQALQG
jgi:2-polyprenyl-6-methoxyphenol hydroxylase-like FAD-dependent oxidoreductase